jgi:NADH-quinone oxidoreductase subunit E
MTNATTSMIDLPEQVKSFFAERRGQYPNQRALLIPVLMECQKHYGYLSDGVASAVGAFMNVPVGEVQSCISFYTMLFTKPTGKYIFGLCRTLNCDLEGALELCHHVEHRFQTPLGEVTPDGLFTFYEVECLCDCHNAPSIQVIKSGKDFRVWWLNNVSQSVLDTVMDEIKVGGDDALRERLVRVVEKQNPPDERRWVWLVTTLCQYPVWIEETGGELIPHDGYGKLDGLKQREPKLWKEIQEGLKK